MRNKKDANGTSSVRRIDGPHFMAKSGELFAYMEADPHSVRGQFTFGIFPEGLSQPVEGKRVELILPEFNECDIADVVRLAHALAYVVAEDSRTTMEMRYDLGCLAACI